MARRSSRSPRERLDVVVRELQSIAETLGPRSTLPRPKVVAAMRFLRGLLTKPVPSASVHAAAREAGIQRDALFEAKRLLGVTAKKAGAAWRWHPPGK